MLRAAMTCLVTCVLSLASLQNAEIRHMTRYTRNQVGQLMQELTSETGQVEQKGSHIKTGGPHL